MSRGSSFAVVVSACLLANALSAPTETPRWRYLDIHSSGPQGMEQAASSHVAVRAVPNDSAKVSIDLPDSSNMDDDDDFDVQPLPSSSSGGGSSIFSLLNLVSSLFPGSSGTNVRIRKMLKEIIIRYVNIQKQRKAPKKRSDVKDNEIEIDYIDQKPPPSPLQRQETEESDSRSDSDESDSNEDDNNNAAEESVETGNKSKQEIDSVEGSNGDNEDSNESDYDSDEPPGGGDGQGGGILGLLAGLSGGEDGSDLGSLLSAVSGIVANLSGDGFDLNALIASALGLFVGLLSEGNENPGAILSSYLLTSVDSISGGGANNNGAFFGSFLSRLIKGISAGGDPDASSEEDADGNKILPMADSGAFFASFLMTLLGDMSKGSSGGSSHPW